MIKTATARARPRDAQAAQEAILNAAEGAFAESGFAGARIDEIARASGYNKSLIFHYFDDKLGLYSAVLRRADKQGLEHQEQIFGTLDLDAPLTVETFRAFLERAIRAIFDYYVSHPRLMRITSWEEAEGWTTIAKIYSQLDPSDVQRFGDIIERARKADVIRPYVTPSLMFYVALNVCRTYLASIPLIEMFSAYHDLSHPDALARAREDIVRFIVHGIIPDSPVELQRPRPNGVTR